MYLFFILGLLALLAVFLFMAVDRIFALLEDHILRSIIVNWVGCLSIFSEIPNDFFAVTRKFPLPPLRPPSLPPARPVKHATRLALYTYFKKIQTVVNLSWLSWRVGILIALGMCIRLSLLFLGGIVAWTVLGALRFSRRPLVSCLNEALCVAIIAANSRAVPVRRLLPNARLPSETVSPISATSTALVPYYGVERKLYHFRSEAIPSSSQASTLIRALHSIGILPLARRAQEGTGNDTRSEDAYTLVTESRTRIRPASASTPVAARLIALSPVPADETVNSQTTNESTPSLVRSSGSTSPGESSCILTPVQDVAGGALNMFSSPTVLGPALKLVQPPEPFCIEPFQSVQRKADTETHVIAEDASDARTSGYALGPVVDPTLIPPPQSSSDLQTLSDSPNASLLVSSSEACDYGRVLFPPGRFTELFVFGTTSSQYSLKSLSDEEYHTSTPRTSPTVHDALRNCVQGTASPRAAPSALDGHPIANPGRLVPSTQPRLLRRKSHLQVRRIGPSLLDDAHQAAQEEPLYGPLTEFENLVETVKDGRSLPENMKFISVSPQKRTAIEHLKFIVGLIDFRTTERARKSLEEAAREAPRPPRPASPVEFGTIPVP